MNLEVEGFLKMTNQEKQELAEFIAEKVLGYTDGTFLASYPLSWRDPSQKNFYKILDDFNSHEVISKKDLVPHIFSPEGFFAVWDAVNTKQPVNVIKFTSLVDKYVCELILSTKPITKTGKDRYEVFYGAVYEGMKDDWDKKMHAIHKELASKMENIPPEFDKVLNENFEDLFK